uniref:dolichyl-diphosphooligosaccharide--protein glycotransferase n=1 Tax=Haptolina ericina TaxID=156174 RepID=A0A7S3B345_9EUKA
MQISAVAIWKALAAIGNPMSLNDVCCYVPVWFGVSATVFLALLTKECSGSWVSASAAACIMAIVPAHIMRSVGGGYDNESIAVTAMCATFYFWCKSLKATPDDGPSLNTYVFGALCGLAYIYMVMAWGGFVFVLNMIGMHAAVLVLCGRYNSKLHRAYTLFFVIGTMGAVRVPPVGMNPFRSMEQLMPLAVFLGFQLLEFVNIQRKKKELSIGQTLVLLVKAAIPFAAALFIVCMYLYSVGYFGPLTARVRGLFVKHTRTGNPLVDSVAEHQPGSTEQYKQFMHHCYYLAPIGFGLSLFRWTDANSFIVLYAVTAYYFASKMARLVILLGPVGSALGGVAVGTAIEFFLLDTVKQTLLGASPADAEPVKGKKGKDAKGVKDKKEEKKDEKADKKKPSFGKKRGKKPSLVEELGEAVSATKEAITASVDSFKQVADTKRMVSTRALIGIGLMVVSLAPARAFYSFSQMFAEQSSRPQIMFKAQLQTGEWIMVDDYREAYHWLRDHTPEDARVMAWWDYGYQIAGIAKRTSIADGNTWNHEHIATLGRILTAPEEEAHSLARHLADYVLVWAGGGGDDLAKSPHLARIGNSVFPGHCSDPTCSQFGFTAGGPNGGGNPTPMMSKSLLYKLCQYGRPGVTLNDTYFQHAYTSKYGKVRIFKVRKVSKKSKDWIANPENRLCDAPGSWYCNGQYPPALQEFVNSRRAFKQLEDFNVKQDAHSKKYQEEYMRRMGGGGAKKSEL